LLLALWVGFYIWLRVFSQ